MRHDFLRVSLYYLSVPLYNSRKQQRLNLRIPTYRQVGQREKYNTTQVDKKSYIEGHAIIFRLPRFSVNHFTNVW